MLNNLVEKIKNFFEAIMKKANKGDETEIRMNARDLGIIGNEFDELYDRLLGAEDDLKEMATRYTIGEPDVKMIDVDESFSKMKKSMKDIRDLAIETRNRKEESDEE